MNTKKLTPAAIRKLGIEAITRELGPVGMIRFFQQYELGYGDYTKERVYSSRRRCREHRRKDKRAKERGLIHPLMQNY